MSDYSDIRVVVGLDFGTTYSGFTYCHVSDDNNLVTNDQWPGEIGQLKTNTALQYNENYMNVGSWGYPALSKRPNKKKKSKDRSKPVELFKLHLGNLVDSLKPKLPVDYKKAITDYLREIGKLIKEMVIIHWSGIDFLGNVLIVITVPAEFSERDKAIMRECAYTAGLIKERFSKNLQFTTEPEAAAIYCMENSLKVNDLNTPGTTFMIVDCGGGTVDLTTRKLLDNKQLGEVTERAGDFCGSTFIDKEFLKALRKILGDHAIDLLRDRHYGQMQYMIQEFCRHVKLPFSGDRSEFTKYELDLEDVVPVVMEYMTEEIREKMEDIDWLIVFEYDDVKSMFDPIVERITQMIEAQLNNTRETCSAMFLVGGFSQSKYLQKIIKQKFQHQVEKISVPTYPIAVISRGAALYGLSMKNSVYSLDKMNSLKFVINERILKYTYGIKVSPNWEVGDPIERRDSDGTIDKFCVIAQRGTVVRVNQEFTSVQLPVFPTQSAINFHIYFTAEYSAEYCDENGMEKLGNLLISLPDVHLGKNRPILFGLTFGRMEITATAKNQLNGQNYQTTLKLDI
ncbi:hypothetical protein RclHR1_00260030 [Rhizophagus clarus]|uniref:Actin-like ATPase domain-containing protein n=1 Tax=Rhizophagus clarus TaxID=94130 RepID=A0A2Z6R1A3_9GLOM|nr:hypothetical protein RclHR1_00260030 [Rhizophagus clarus]GES97279.1 hypothetical protein GLOIN_2v1788281 [Rhizophagus clarus]